jgi:hypothetical protein
MNLTKEQIESLSRDTCVEHPTSDDRDVVFATTLDSENKTLLSLKQLYEAIK